MFNHRAQVGSLLLQHGIINESQLRQGLARAQETSCRVGEALVALGLCTDVEIGRVLAQQSELPFVDLKATPPNPHALRLVPRETAQQYMVVPVRMDGQRLLVAALNPFDIRLDEVLRKMTGLPIIVASAVEGQLREVLRDYEKLRAGLGQRLQIGQSLAPQNGDVRRQPGSDQISLAECPAAVQAANTLFADAVRRGATDLQFNPGENRLRIRARVDGQMIELSTLEAVAARGLMARLKLLAGMSATTSTGQPQSGTFTVRVDGREIEWKASLITGVDGEVMLLKTTSHGMRTMRLDEIGLPVSALRGLRRSIRSHGGLHILAGQAGAGVTTTQYALMQDLSQDDLQAFSIEVEVESRIQGAQQFATKGKHGVPAEGLIEICLEQSPDALFVSDLGSAAQAAELCSAAAGGRTIVCGMHAPSVHQAISRLLDLGLPPHVLGSALSVVVAQRVVRQNCPHCSVDYTPPAEMRRALQACFGDLSNCRFKKGAGCSHCGGRGTMGRLGVFEYFLVDEDFRYLLAERVPPSVLDQHIRERGFRSLEFDAFEKASMGCIPPEEILNLGLSLAVEMESRPGLLARKDDPFRLPASPAAAVGTAATRWQLSAQRH